MPDQCLGAMEEGGWTLRPLGKSILNGFAAPIWFRSKINRRLVQELAWFLTVPDCQRHQGAAGLCLFGHRLAWKGRERRMHFRKWAAFLLL